MQPGHVKVPVQAHADDTGVGVKAGVGVDVGVGVGVDVGVGVGVEVHTAEVELGGRVSMHVSRQFSFKPHQQPRFGGSFT
ncbi:MAG: hypothetical protein A3B68_04830 [Candidatus Melainabacteria bacterium RIFCSPHIGHO2_02_FULL_34_12]|nr:MAG: hypothetical protein A3B68_04830 [Candidatus Melainabacteria bacterium RIFCSPHIGHO2_02_FULL_34_12]